jgi:IS30 family transposase
MSYTHVSLGERYVIYHLTLYGLSRREIGRRLGRHHSTIGRELTRNGPCHEGAVYVHDVAQDRAAARRRRVRHRRRGDHGRLRRYVVSRLRRDWSPEQVAGRLRRDHPADTQMRISAETIYQWIYHDAAGGGDLFRHLRRRHRRRRKQGGYGTGRGLIPGRVAIAERPAIVACRARIGDWEGDTLEGARGKGGIASLVERKSRYLLAAPLTDKSATTLAAQAIGAFRKIPRRARKTLTVDNGKEFARFKLIEARTGLAVFFADPYAAWQRGTNENTNGLLRQYFPKRSDLRALTHDELAQALQKLNHRPRKGLGYQSPHEVIFTALRGALAT